MLVSVCVAVNHTSCSAIVAGSYVSASISQPPQAGAALVHTEPSLVRTLPDVQGVISLGTVILVLQLKLVPFFVLAVVSVAALPVVF